MKSSQCEDGCSPVQYKVAFGKARGKPEFARTSDSIRSLFLTRSNIDYAGPASPTGAVECGEGSRSLMKRSVENPSYLRALQSVSEWALVPAPGGALIRSFDHEILGAVGIASNNSDADEAVAHQAIEYVGFKADI